MSIITARKSLSSFMWEEWLSSLMKGEKGALWEIRGILCGIPSEKISPRETVFSSGRLWIFRRLKKLWDEAESLVHREFSPLLSIPRSMKGKVLFCIPEELLPLVCRFPDDGVIVEKLRMDWLRGLWGSCGSLYIPKSGYYMSFRIPSKEVETHAVVLLKKERFSFGRRFVQGKFEITLRNQEEIVTLLTRLGLVKTSLRMEEKAIVRSMRNRANKLVNCDTSNIRKSLEAASRQIEIARKAMNSLEFDSFSDILKKLIFSRLTNPSATLEELGKMQSPPVSKSTIKYRWKKLEDMFCPQAVCRASTR